MRKIKSVRLKDNKLSRSANGVYLTVPSYDEFYIRNHEEEFEIEYEPEGFEFVSFPQTVIFNNGLIINTKANSELNRLADWCDGQFEKDKDEAILYFAIYANPKNELKVSTFMFTINQGLKLNSKKSAELFITELDKPENSDYKNYFIELLKKTRL